MTTSFTNCAYTPESTESTKFKFNDIDDRDKRSIRASSLALPNHSLLDLLENKQNLFDKINLTPPPKSSNARRHSSDCFPMIDNDDFQIPQRQIKKPQALPLVPPPVPKRTFQGKFSQKQQEDNFETQKRASNSTLDSYHHQKTYSQYRSERICKSAFDDQSFNYFPQNNKNQMVGGCHNSISAASFDDIGDNDDFVIFNKKMTSIDSNRSSSDSNKSQTTIDTGYVSSNENDRSIFTTASSTKGTFRSRFSSEDTQSSLDSFMSADLHRTDTIDSLPINDSPFSLKKNIFNFDQKINQTRHNNFSPGSADDKMDNMSPKPRRLPMVPTRKQNNVPPKLPPPMRGHPPAPPLRTQTSFDSRKFQKLQQSLMNKNSDSIQEMYSRPGGMRRITHKPPPLNQIHHSKINQRQDSTISSDSFSVTSSPGYNSKNMEAPLLQHASKINRSNMRHQDSNDNFNNSVRNVPPRVTMRQDSSISSDSFSQTSSPSYNTKIMEAPLLSHASKMHKIKPIIKNTDEIIKDVSPGETNANSAIIKSASTPASLQTIVRLSNGSNASLQHKILKARKNSNPYVTRGRLRFRICQILLNAIALLAIAGGLAAYFNAYPSVKFINKTIITPPRQIAYEFPAPKVDLEGKNPAPGVCLPVIVKFCQQHKLPYNFTVFPNYIGHFGQPEATVELDVFDALVDVQCYELVPLFLCSLFVPKCGMNGAAVPPCKSLCIETMRRCGFFFDVFGLELPEYLSCKLFNDSPDIDACVGMAEFKESQKKQRKPMPCSGFLCDIKRCIPSEWKCDGHVDCQDQTDESQCNECPKGSIHCGNNRCMSQKHVCDGSYDCPWGQDERNCIRLSERNGDLGRGTLEVYKADVKQWAPACVKNWDPNTSPTQICSMLGYSSVNSSRTFVRGTNRTLTSNSKDASTMWRMYQKKQTNMMKEFQSCNINDRYPVAELTCSNFECGKIKNREKYKPSLRIIGGQTSRPGDWPFIAAILGGPEEVFYCAGVLIADQWVLTASHCIGNHTLRNVNDWTIQLGITRRHAHTYYGQKVKVKNVIPHPAYNVVIAHDNDIALFQLATRVAFHEHLIPVCLPPPHIKELYPGTNCTVVGWGKKEDKNSNPNATGATYEPALNEVNVPVLNRDLCNEWLDMLNVTEGMICAGYQDGGKDACQGDSGGPLLCPYPNEKDRWFVGGIVSWGIMCAHPRLPGVYANVPKYIPWIMQQINKYSVVTTDNIGR